ncbi:hypothetical protein [Paractinoplanes durhamensis]|uniref:hypothetical protein n=1 Tax=Paractinoplanes durhamensis TaxID=113563 RepID=UPI003626CD11
MVATTRPARRAPVTRSRIGALIALVAAVLLAVALSLALGAQTLTVSEIWHAVVAPDPSAPATAIVRDLRLPGPSWASWSDWRSARPAP